MRASVVAVICLTLLALEPTLAGVAHARDVNNARERMDPGIAVPGAVSMYEVVEFLKPTELQAEEDAKPHALNLAKSTGPGDEMDGVKEDGTPDPADACYTGDAFLKSGYTFNECVHGEDPNNPGCCIKDSKNYCESSTSTSPEDPPIFFGCKCIHGSHVYRFNQNEENKYSKTTNYGVIGEDGVCPPLSQTPEIENDAPPVGLIVGIAAAVLICGCVGFYFWRKKSQENDTLNVNDLHPLGPVNPHTSKKKPNKSAVGLPGLDPEPENVVPGMVPENSSNGPSIVRNGQDPVTEISAENVVPESSQDSVREEHSESSQVESGRPERSESSLVDGEHSD